MANAIAESMYAQCDPDGNQYVLLDDIFYFRKTNTEISIEDQNIVVKGRASLRSSTVGWQVCWQWKDRSTKRESLSNLKESHYIETEEYDHLQGISHELAFNWWAPHVLKKRDRIISLVIKKNRRYLKKTCRFRIEVPITVAEAIELDTKKCW